MHAYAALARSLVAFASLFITVAFALASPRTIAAESVLGPAPTRASTPSRALPTRASALPALTDFTRRVGTQYWLRAVDGRIRSGARLDVAVETLAALGGRAIRMLFSAGEYCPNDTDGDGSELLRRALEPDAAAAFAHPAIHTYQLTALDCPRGGRYSFDPARYAVPGETAVVEDGMRDLALHLMRTYRGTGKRFIVSNWETDNAVYCSAAYAYALNLRVEVTDLDGTRRVVDYRDWCDRIYATIYRGIPNPTAALAGARLWFEARQRGVDIARAIAAREGVTGVEVLHAPEFSIVRALAANGIPSVLHDVLPALSPRPDMASYSAYETTNLRPENGETVAANAIPARIRDDLAFAAAVIGSPWNDPTGAPGVPVFIGEFGYAVGTLTAADTVRLTALVHDTALALGSRFVFNWQLYDDAFGLYSIDGRTLSQLGAYYRCRFGAPDARSADCAVPPRTIPSRPPIGGRGTGRRIE